MTNEMTTEPVTQAARHLPQKERTALIRRALKAAGIKGASVTSARGSMCYWTNVRIDLGVAHPASDWRTHIVHECTFCAERLALRRKVEGIILAAHPDLADRSDLQVDYSNFTFTVEVR